MTYESIDRTDGSSAPSAVWKGGCALLGVLLMAGCGGGGEGLVAPEASTAQTAREQAALNRAMSINANALARTVQGERAARASSQ